MDQAGSDRWARLAAGNALPSLPQCVDRLELRARSAEQLELRCLSTDRLELLGWGAEDFQRVAALCADPRVMRFFPSVLDQVQSRELFDQIIAHFTEWGYGPFSVWLRQPRQWIGFVGLARVGEDLPFAPAVEVLWRLYPDAWGQGYATEAAQAALDLGFRQLALDEIVAFTTETNEPSQAVMRRLRMHRNPLEDFDHPRLPAGHPLLRHRLYRLERSAFTVSPAGVSQSTETTS